MDDSAFHNGGLRTVIEVNYPSTVTRSLLTYALIVYFSWALYTVGRDLARLKDYPEEEESLRKEVEQAR